MERLLKNMVNSAALYGVIAFFSFWTMMACVWFDFAEWTVPYLVYFMASLPLFFVLDLIASGWRKYRT